MVLPTSGSGMCSVCLRMSDSEGAIDFPPQLLRTERRQATCHLVFSVFQCCDLRGHAHSHRVDCGVYGGAASAHWRRSVFSSEVMCCVVCPRVRRLGTLAHLNEDLNPDARESSHGAGRWGVRSDISRRRIHTFDHFIDTPRIPNHRIYLYL